ncbi:MAG TPA: polysaccharide deacetylase family protein [Kofleriaceae bacterium]|nr:polysaccharide deacetylase family protein [Kofleriaceae bacterium]
MTSRQVAISIDLDSIACYYKIHALGEAPAELEHAILQRALPRAAALFAKHGVHVTWFVVGKDVDGHAANGTALRALADAGDELGNHSYSHFYDLARKDAHTIDDELSRCDRVLRQLVPHVRGFRAPGYDVSPAMFDTLARLGYRYDSSVFPSPAYYAAKGVVMAALRAIGRPSGAVMTDPKLLAAPAEPYRPAMTAPWRKGQAPLVELPIATTPWLRVHAIGTSLLVAPEWLRDRLVDAMAKRNFWNLELHGIDFADAEQDGIPGELVDRQPDLRIPIAEKLARFERLLDQLAARWEIVTLGQAASRVQLET